MANIIGSLIAELKLDTSAFDKSVDGSKTKAQQLVSGLSSVGGAVVGAGIGAAVVGIGALSVAIVKGVGDATNWANTLDGVSDLLGTTSKESAGLALAAERIGMPVDELTGRFAKLTNGLLDANGNLGPTGKSLQALGINALDANGNLRSSTDIIQDVANVLGNMPDGLEKSGLEMELFGKSGAEMGDILTSLANGGMQDFIGQADQMGLAFSDEKTQSLIEYQKNQEKLKQTLQGVSVSLGLAVIPALSKLADTVTATLARPDVQAAIQSFTKFIGDLVMKVVTFIPVVIGWFVKLADWFSKNKPVIVGILAALGAAVAVFVYTTVIPAAIAAITAMAPIILVMAAIGLAVGLLYKAWTSNWGGIQDKLKAVWDWLRPVIMDGIIPALKQVADWVSGAVVGAFNALKDAIQWVIEKLEKLNDWLQGLTLPPWLTPGSPTPLEMGIRGINSALSDMNQTALPVLKQNLNINSTQTQVSAPVTVPSQYNEKRLAKAIVDALMASGVVG